MIPNSERTKRTKYRSFLPVISKGKSLFEGELSCGEEPALAFQSRLNLNRSSNVGRLRKGLSPLRCHQRGPLLAKNCRWGRPEIWAPRLSWALWWSLTCQSLWVCCFSNCDGYFNKLVSVCSKREKIYSFAKKPKHKPRQEDSREGYQSDNHLSFEGLFLIFRG